jgi:hypothetical protein
MLSLVLVSLLASQDKMDNPEYSGWKTFTAGSWARYKYSAGPLDGDPLSTGEYTRTLKEFTADVAIVEQAMKLDFETKPSPRDEKIPALIEKPDKYSRLENGEEEIEVLGKKVKCTWTVLTREWEDKRGKRATTVKNWWNPDVPGAMVRSEQTDSRLKKRWLFTLEAYERKK